MTKTNKIGYYIEVTIYATDFYAHERRVYMHCVNTGELKQRLFMYKGRVKVLGWWNGVEMKDIDKVVKKQLKDEKLI